MESLTSLMSMLAASSLLGVLAATLLERLVPILPSYVLLMSIGIAAVGFDAPLLTVVSASVAGSILGCGVYYYAASSIGPVRARRWGNRLARLSGVSPRRMRRMLIAFRRDAPPLSVLSQLVPGLRLVAPGVAGAVGVPALTYFPFSAIGIAVWNLFFIAAGYFAAQRNPQTEAASIALVVIGLFLGIEVIVGALWWLRRRYQRAHGPASFRAKAIVQ